MTPWFSRYSKQLVPLLWLTSALLGAALGQWAANDVAVLNGGVSDSVVRVDSSPAGAEFEAPLPQPVSVLGDAPQADKAASGVANIGAEIVPGGVVEGNSVDRMWETNAQQSWQVRPQPLTPQNWYITGVVQRGAATQVIVQFDGDPKPRFYTVGETLPGGSKLVWVRPDAIGVVTPNKKNIDVPVLSNSARRELVLPGSPR